MTDHQKFLLKLLQEIDDICQKYHITYYLGGGTTIGAVRHEGFVPWDDDADVLMTRNEWKKFVQAFQKEAPKNPCLGFSRNGPPFSQYVRPLYRYRNYGYPPKSGIIRRSCRCRTGYSYA